MDEHELRTKEKKEMARIENFMGYEMYNTSMPTATLYIQYKGIWDMDGLMRTVVDFMTENKFRFYERLQRHRHPGPFGVERDYVFAAHRNVDEYHRFNLALKMETFDEHDIEITLPNGTKKMMAKGRLWIQMSCKVEWDYEKKWEGSWFSIHLRKFMNYYVFFKRLLLPHWDKMYYSILLKLHGLITERLKLESRINEHRYGAGVH